MQTRVSWNPYTGTWTRTGVYVNAPSFTVMHMVECVAGRVAAVMCIMWTVALKNCQQPLVKQQSKAHTLVCIR